MIISQAITSLGHLDKLLTNLRAELYAGPSDLLEGASIGSHMRHIIEFYECAICSTGNVVNYALRKRDPLIETDPCAAKDKIRLLQNRLLQTDGSLQLEIICDQSEGTVSSTLARELMYCNEHSVHHLAMIRIALREAGMSHLANPDLGVAASTLKHRQAVNNTVTEHFTVTNQETA